MVREVLGLGEVHPHDGIDGAGIHLGKKGRKEKVTVARDPAWSTFAQSGEISDESGGRLGSHLFS